MKLDTNCSLKGIISCLSLTILVLGTSSILPPDTLARNINVNRNVNNNFNNRNVNVNRNVNRNVNNNFNNRNVNINRNVDVNVHHGYNGGHYHNPVATAVAVTAAAVVTAAVVGSIVYSLPPSCSSTRVGNVVYQQCGNSWYQPQYSGTTVQYIVVNPPN